MPQTRLQRLYVAIDIDDTIGIHLKQTVDTGAGGRFIPQALPGKKCYLLAALQQACKRHNLMLMGCKSHAQIISATARDDFQGISGKELVEI